MSASGALKLVVVGRAIGMRVVLVVDLLHHVLLVVITRMIVVTMVAVTLPRHFRRCHRTIDTRHRLQHTLQRIRIEADAVLRILDSHVIGALALRLVATVIVVDDIEEIAILHLQFGVVRRLGVMQLFLT